MGLLSKLLGGGGVFKDALRAELEAERIVVLEERLRGSLHYRHFKAPGKRFNGKVVPMRIAFAITEQRICAYGYGGRSKLMNSRWGEPQFEALDFSREGDDLLFLVDYDKLDQPKVSGQITIKIRTPNAERIAEEIRARL